MIFQSNLQSEGVQFSDKTMEGVWCFPNGLTGPLRSLVSAPGLVFGSSRTSSTGTTGRCDCDCSVVPVVHCADTHTTPSYYPIKHDIEPETLGWKIVFNGVFRAGKSRMIECPAVRLPVVWVKLAKSSRSKLDDHSRVFEKQEHHVDLVCPACSW